MKKNMRWKRAFLIVLMSVALLNITTLISVNVDKVTVHAAAATKLNTPSITVLSRTPSTVNFTISKVTGASGYRVYRAASKAEAFVYIGKTTSLKYKDTKVSTSRTYYYKVRAYKTINGKTITSKYSAIKAAGKSMSKTTSITAKNSGSVNTITWSKVSNASLYNVYRSTSKTGGYRFIGASKTTAYKDSKISANTTYYYRMRGYRKSAGVKYYGLYSNVVSVTTGSTSSSPVSGNTSDNEAESYAKEVLDLVNKERTSRGLSELTTTTSLRDAANKRAVEIEQSFSHTRPNGTSPFTALEEYGVSYQAAGENIAYGQRTPAEVVEAWMNSEGHRKNILSESFGKMGVGYYKKNNTIYWVQLFTN
ncbi:CAP domain-containing protein [Anaeromicropila populeti]|uniref:Uncharacterized conserved protein YkwD, contains CAP (CSP/antigen 5/PR1) domain n=1 Tax=Anaeromicropila populeti TaxID=37658 RepID=A0A1I6JTQ7_9FIRM|nr:CAP domain-containing protein [Anaeromicropila populeti]SFR81910.1 Uncharacterized conserved protein YkwD, contains CAP (CSP/antigen 5/PR1) domain [Anaeromicropila populeti]